MKSIYFENQESLKNDFILTKMYFLFFLIIDLKARFLESSILFFT
jgi:hypothetical protein